MNKTNIIYVNSTDEYFIEAEKRENEYKKACEISGDLWDKYEKNKSLENHRAFFDFFPNVDRLYKDWKDGVQFIKIEDD